MSGYQRFISYIYAYSPDGKGRNVGFAKVEIRGGQKQIGIHLKGVYGMESMQVAVFWRDGNGIDRFPIRNISIYSGTAQAQYVLNHELFREYGRGFEDAAGIVIYPENEESRAYVTIWDEEEFYLEMMKRSVTGEEEEGYIEESSELVCSNQDKENQLEEELVCSEKQDMGELEEEEKQPEDEKEEMLEEEQEERERQMQAQVLYDLFKQLKGEKDDGTRKEDTDEAFLSTAEVKEEEKEEEEAEDIGEEMKLWHSLRKLYPQAKPFQSQKNVECLKIKPGSIGRLPRQTWIFANNNFVLYGYMKYHYLILAKMENQYFLGVPGKRNQNVKILAQQFGFDTFYPVDERWGYWCVPILSPKEREN